MPRLRRRRCGSAAASACAATPRWPSSRAPTSPNTSPGATRSRLHSATQIPGIIRDALADALDLPGHRLRVVAPDVGGGFGGKGSLYPEEIFVCAAARALARAVKWTSDRMEDLTATSQAFDEIVDAELALDADGSMLALRADVIGDVGAYSIYPWTAALEPVQVVSFLPGPYRIEHYRGRVQAVATAKAPTGPYRGVGRPISTFVMERLVDMAAATAAASIRRRSGCAISCRRTAFPHKIGSGIVWDKSGFVEGLEAACDEDRLRRRCARKQAEARARRQMVRHRHRVLRGADRHRLAHLGRARHADQHRHRDRDHPHRLDRRRHGGVRHRVARAGAGDDARAGDRRASRRARRGRPRHPGRQRRGAGRHRHLCEPQHRAGRRRRAARLRGAAREGAQRRLASARSRARRSRRRGRAHHGRRHRSRGDVPRRGARGLFRHGAAAAGGARGARRDQDLRSGVRHHHVGDAHRGAGDRSGDLSRSASTASSSRRIAAASSIR